MRQLAPARLLIVDDDMIFQRLLSRWLSAAGYSCANANSAEAGWAYLNKHPVDLLTLDVGMPGRSGLELLEQSRRMFPDTAVLMLTAHDEASKAIQALTHGASGYLIKPAKRNQLVAQVGSSLEQRRLAIESRQYTNHLEQQVREQTRAIRSAHEETIHRLVKASLYRDEETGAHIRRSGWYSELLAATAGWSTEHVEQIRLAAPMHDVGKLGIPDAILRKPGKLTDDEIRIMQTHTVLGAKMLSGSASPVLRMAQEIAQCHHERWDGKGYPSGLARYEIPEAARMVAVVDVYDALTHDRVYRPALPEAEALKMMSDARDTQFDPRLLDIFLSLLPEMRAIALALPDNAEEEDYLISPATDPAVHGSNVLA